MPIRFQLDPPARLSRTDNRLFIIALLVFGISGAGAGFNWLSKGNIVIREGPSYSGPRNQVPRYAPLNDAPVAGSIGAGNLLFYPLCLSWIGLGLSMVTLSALCALSSNVLFLRLSSYSCVAILLLAFGTVGAAIWLGP